MTRHIGIVGVSAEGAALNGRFEETARSFVKDLIEREKGRGADAVVLACTELPLLVSDVDSSLPILDSTRILARAALREAMAGVDSAPPPNT